jgi:ABC-2 type transport system ATP-binding protein
MNRGKLVALDTPAGLKASMREPLLELRVADAPRAVKALRGVPEIVSAGLFGRAVHLTVRDPEAARVAIRAALGAAGLAAGELVAIPPSLEDVFVHLVERSGGAAVN